MSGVIVVGIDGSEASQAALRWAVEEARLRGARLEAVHAWTFVPPQPLGDPGLLAMPAGDVAGELSAENEAAHTVLASAVEEAIGGDSSPALEQKIVEGDPGDVLVKEGAEADLVVVGSHGRSGLTAALLGSVSRHVVDHATCPVVVVKTPR